MARQWGPTGKGKGCEIESCWKYLTIINGHVNLQYESAVKLDWHWMNGEREAWKRVRLETTGPKPRYRKLALIASHIYD